MAPLPILLLSSPLPLLLLLLLPLSSSATALAERAEDVRCSDLYSALVCCVEDALKCAPNATRKRLCFARPGVACNGRAHYPSNTTTAENVVVCDGVEYALQDSVFDTVGKEGEEREGENE